MCSARGGKFCNTRKEGLCYVVLIEEDLQYKRSSVAVTKIYTIVLM